MLLLVAAAFAADPVAPAATPDDLVHLARERARDGDYEGVRILADEALAIPGPHAYTARYLVALSWELGGDPQQALSLYDALLAEQPTDDVRFRRAECLGTLGRYAEARDQLAAIGHLRDRAPADRFKIAVLEGVWDLGLGEHRRGDRALAAALDRADPAEAAWYQAMARHALLAEALTAADTLALDGSDRARTRALERRAALIRLAEDQLAASIRAREPSFALDGFLLVGRAYATLGDELLAATPAEPAEHVAQVWANGAKYLDRGLDFAALSDWTAEPVPTIRAERDALVGRADALRVAP